MSKDTDKATLRRVYRLDDSVIAQIARLLQIAILSGTDITDHMRQLVLEPGEKRGTLKLTKEYIEKDAKDIDSMFDHLEELMDNNPDLEDRE